MIVVDLADETGAAQTVFMRALTGYDELRVGNASSSTALALLDRLVTAREGQPVELSQCSLSQIDRMLAMLYRSIYGDLAECRAQCANCGKAYEFTLDLPELMAVQDASRVGPPAPDGTWMLQDGRKVRAPLLADMENPEDSKPLLTRLVVDGDPDEDPVAVTDFLEQSAPLLVLDLDASCPLCESASVVRFDMAIYLTQRLIDERPFLYREVHLIASAYGWPYSEIMAMARSERRAFAGLIGAERTVSQ